MPGTVARDQPLSADIHLIERVEYVVDVISERKLPDCLGKSGVCGICY